MKAYSQDLRDRIVTALENALETREEIAHQFGVSRSFVQKLWRRQRDTGCPAALPHGGGQTRALRPHAEQIRAEVAHQPDVTLMELCERIEHAGGPRSSLSMMWREVRRLNLPRKKKVLYASQRDTPRVQRLRQTYQDSLTAWVVKHLKFIDESNLHVSFTRLYGRAAPGVRVVETVPYQPDEKWTVIAALSLSGVSAPWVIPGSMDGVAFETYVQAILLPTLKRGDMVILDNLPVHKSAEVARLLHTRGARLQLLPPYSPDLNPIELCWAKIKTALRTAKARSFDELLKALQAALQTITLHDAQAWLKHCGYGVHA